LANAKRFRLNEERKVSLLKVPGVTFKEDNLGDQTREI
jgi:hypothetical protein